MRSFTLYLVAFRVALALLTRTVFQPDEFFQSLEPAHHAVFGYGHLTWEWATTRPIRSIIHPGLFIPGYWLLKVTKLDRFDVLLIAIPKIIHGVLSAGTDIGIAELARVTLGNNYVSTAVLLSTTNFFNALALSRTLSNSLETAFSSLAFAYYPWDAHSNASPHVMFNRTKLRQTLLFSAIACLIRPTNAVIWVFLYARLLWAFHSYRTLTLAFLKDGILTSAFAVTVMLTADSLYYGKLTFTPYNFLLTNLSSVSLFYGGSPWHFYLTRAIPILCTTALPFTAHGIYTILKTRNSPRKNYPLQTMLSTILWSIGVYSLAGHKEWRFIHPLLPLLHIISAKSLVDLQEEPLIPLPKADSRTEEGKTTKSKPVQRRKPVVKPSSTLLSYFPVRPSHLTLLLAITPVTLYAVLFYCSGPISVMSYIRSLPLSETGSFTDTIGFLTPCHSTPTHSYLHREVLAAEPGRIWSLGCEPPLGGQILSAYQDQTNVFFDSPKAYITKRFPSSVKPDFPPSPFPSSRPGQMGVQEWRHEWPKHLILFGDLLKDEYGIKDVLHEKGYREVRKYGRDWEGEGRRKGGVRVWRWQGAR